MRIIYTTPRFQVTGHIAGPMIQIEMHIRQVFTDWPHFTRIRLINEGGLLMRDYYSKSHARPSIISTADDLMELLS